MKKLISIMSVLCSVILAFSPVSGAESGRDISSFYTNSWAVVIGINTYPDPNFPSLDYAVNDAKAAAARFQAMGFKVIALENEDATKARIMKVLKTQLPAQVGPHDRVVIFYAGHGAAGTLPSGQELGFIIPTDAQSTIDGQTLQIIGTHIAVEDYERFMEATNFISVEDIRDVSDMLPAKHIYYIIDGCYSGFLDPAAYSRLRPSQSTQRVAAKQASAGERALKLQPIDKMEKNPKSIVAGATTSGEPVTAKGDTLEVITARDTVQVLTAGSSGEPVHEKLGHGLFTHHLLLALDGSADINQDCVVTASELGTYVKQEVPKASDFNQIPLFNRISGEGEFIFIPPKCQQLDEKFDLQPPVGDKTWTKTDGYRGPKKTRYEEPTRVLVDAEENLYVLDADLKRIFKFDAEGQYVPGPFEDMEVDKDWEPTSLALDNEGHIWVYLSWQGRTSKKKPGPPGQIRIYRSDGAPAAGWTGGKEPLTACYNPDGTEVPFPSVGLVALDIEENVILLDQKSGAMAKCDRNGSLLYSWGQYQEHESIEDLSDYKTVTNPQGLAVDMLGYIYVADTGGHGIQRYYAGQWAGGWPNFKSKKEPFFNSPHGLAVDGRLRLYVADTENHRVKKYTSASQKLLACWGKKRARKGKKYGEFKKPMDIAVNQDGTVIYVADTGNERVQKFMLP